MAPKTDIFHNLINAEEIVSKANESVSECFNQYTYTIVTVGRLGTEKGQIMIPKAAKMLTEKGVSFVWYVVGDGIMRGKIENEIRNNEVEGKVILLGEKKNPFPYIKNSS